MLASLLPGFRDVRSALVSGYMWVAAAWLIGAHIWPHLLTQDKLFGEPVIKLLTILGSAGSLAALSLLCLIVGEFTSGSVQTLFFRFSKVYVQRLTPENFYNAPRGWLRLFRPMSFQSMNRVYVRMQRAHAERMADSIADSPSADNPSAPAEQVAIQALREVLYLSPRVIVAKPELYAEYDRVKAESTFRDAILVPLPILAAGFLLNVNVALWVKLLLAALVLVIDTFLFVQARHRFSVANSIVAHSLADGTISSAAIGDG